MKNSVLLLLTCLCICACKKNDEALTSSLPVPEVSYSDFSNLKTGNYWIYERFNLDTTGGTYPRSIYLTAVILKKILL